MLQDCIKLKQYKKNELDSVKYEDIFGDPQQQLQVTKVFQTLICIRERLLERDQEPACLGKNTGPSG